MYYAILSKEFIQDITPYLESMREAEPAALFEHDFQFKFEILKNTKKETEVNLKDAEKSDCIVVTDDANISEFLKKIQQVFQDHRDKEIKPYYYQATIELQSPVDNYELFRTIVNGHHFNPVYGKDGTLTKTKCMGAHSDFWTLKLRMDTTLYELNKHGFKVKYYEIKSLIIDSNIEDERNRVTK